MDERHVLQALSSSPLVLLLGYIVIELLKAQLFAKRRRHEDDEFDTFKCKLNQDFKGDFLYRLKDIERRLEDIDKKLS